MTPRLAVALSWATLSLLVLVLACRSQSPEPDPSNELPFGFLDDPTPGAQVQREFLVRGWAPDDGEIREIRIFVDGRFLVRTSLNDDRPDVRAAHPRYARGHDRHGWRVTVALQPSVTAGTHTILAQAVDDRGATRDIGSAQIALIQ